MASSAANLLSGIEVIKQGYLNKKSPAGVPGFRVWQRRWFILRKEPVKSSGGRGQPSSNLPQRTVFIYAKSAEEPDPIQVIPVKAIVAVSIEPSKRKGGRFDVSVENSRVYALDAANAEEAQEWVNALTDAICDRNRRISKTAQQAGLTLTQEWTKLQAAFFKLKFLQLELKDPLPDNPNEKAVSSMNKGFASECLVLDYILKRVCPTQPPKTHLTRKFSVGVSPGTHPHLSNDNSVDSLTTISETFDDGDAFNWQDGEATIGRRRNYGRAAATVDAYWNKMIDNGDEKLARSLSNSEFMRQIRHVFGRSDVPFWPAPTNGNNDPNKNINSPAPSSSHSLAIRVLWLILNTIHGTEAAAAQFSDDMSIFCGEARFSQNIKTAILDIVFQDDATLVANADIPIKVGMRKPFIQPLALPALFAAMKGSEWVIRGSTLEDITSALIGHHENCNAILALPDWQVLLFALLTDIPASCAPPLTDESQASGSMLDKSPSLSNVNTKSPMSPQRPYSSVSMGPQARIGKDGPPKLSEDELRPHQKKVYNFCLNLFSIINFHRFSFSSHFVHTLTETLDSLYAFAGATDRSQAVAQVLLYTLLMKINAPSARKSLFASESKKSIPWVNLMEFINCLKIWIFQTAHWRTQTVVKPDLSNNTVKVNSSMGIALSSSTFQSNSVRMPTSPYNTNTLNASQSMNSPMVKLSLSDSNKTVLEQSRTVRSIASNSFINSDQYGVHFDPVNGSCVDVCMIRILLNFLTSMKLNLYTPENLIGSSNNLDPESTENNLYLKKCVAEFEFFQDSLTLLSLLNYRYIEENKISFRYVGVCISKFLTSDQKGRGGLINEVKSIIDGSKNLGFTNVGTGTMTFKGSSQQDKDKFTFNDIANMQLPPP